MHVRDALVGAWQEGEVEAAVVVEVADDPGALAGDFDGHGAVREAAILQAWPGKVKFAFHYSSSPR